MARSSAHDHSAAHNALPDKQSVTTNVMLRIFDRMMVPPLVFLVVVVTVIVVSEAFALRASKRDYFDSQINRVPPMSVADDNYLLKLLEESHAWDILSWRYPSPYDFYNPPIDDHQEHYVRQFLNPDFSFHAVLDAGGTMAGFCSFGSDGQVPGGDYSDEALDIGVGMRPELTGQGKGAAFFGAILGYALGTLSAEQIRLTVAKFNQRALKLYENFGFEVNDEFLEHPYAVPYSILVRKAAPL